MADNVAITAGSGTSIAADDISSVWYQRVKLSVGPDGTAADCANNAGAVGATVPRVTFCSDSPGMFAEDAACSSADVGHSILAVRRDVPTVSSGTDNDYSTVNVDATGKLWVSGTVAEDAAASSGDYGHSILGVRRDAAAVSSGTDGDHSTINVDATGKLWVSGAFAEDAAHTTADIGIFNLGVISVGAGTSATAGDYAGLTLDTLGNLQTIEQGASLTRGVSGVPVTGDLSSLTSVTDAPTGGQKLVIDEIVFGAGAVGSRFIFSEETSGTVVFTGYCPINDTKVYRPRAKIKLATADKKLQVLCASGTAHSVTVSYRSEA